MLIAEFRIAECNSEYFVESSSSTNQPRLPTDALIYPGLGLGAILSQSRRMTDTMIIAGTRRLASLSPALLDPSAALLPDFGEAPHVNLEVAVAVATQSIEEGSAGVSWGKKEVRARARALQWLPIYGEYVYDEEGEQ